MKNKIINYLKYHHAASLICFSFIAIILTIFFSCGIYGNESLNDIDKDLKNYHSNIYVTTFYKSVALLMLMKTLIYFKNQKQNILIN